jgi:hypothetical protein
MEDIECFWYFLKIFLILLAVLGVVILFFNWWDEMKK